MLAQIIRSWLYHTAASHFAGFQLSTVIFFSIAFSKCSFLSSNKVSWVKAYWGWDPGLKRHHKYSWIHWGVTNTVLNPLLSQREVFPRTLTCLPSHSQCLRSARCFHFPCFLCSCTQCSFCEAKDAPSEHVVAFGNQYKVTQPSNSWHSYTSALIPVFLEFTVQRRNYEQLTVYLLIGSHNWWINENSAPTDPENMADR